MSLSPGASLVLSALTTVLSVKFIIFQEKLKIRENIWYFLKLWDLVYFSLFLYFLPLYYLIMKVIYIDAIINFVMRISDWNCQWNSDIQPSIFFYIVSHLFLNQSHGTSASVLMKLYMVKKTIRNCLSHWPSSLFALFNGDLKSYWILFEGIAFELSWICGLYSSSLISKDDYNHKYIWTVG